MVVPEPGPTGFWLTRRIRPGRSGTRCGRRGIKATIPQPSNQLKGRLARGSRGGRPPKFDKVIYKDRNTIERTFNRLRGFRAVATRYDERDFVYRGTIDVASIRIWLANPRTQDLRDTP